MQPLDIVNRFPYTHFWRIKQYKEINHCCGGFCSLLVLLVVFTLLITKLMGAFKMDSATVKESLKTYVQSATAELLTSSTDPKRLPVMMGLSFPSGTIASYTVQAFYNDGTTKQTITMSQCTQSHFSLLSSTEDISNEFQLSNTLCLPLNQNYTLGGKRYSTQIRSEKEKTLWFEISCSGSCSVGDPIDFFTMASSPNPSQVTQSWTTSLYRKRIVTTSSEQRFYADLVDTFIKKVTQIFPFQSKEIETEALVLDKNFDQEVYTSGSSPGNVKVIVGTSTAVVTYKQTFISILDALAFVGGIYSSMLSLFLFMPYYGAFFYQIYMGKSFLKKKEYMSDGFWSFFKDQFAWMLTLIKINTDWEGVEVRKKVRGSIKKLMDVEYMQKRMDFFEKSLSVLLEKHQLKGLQLLQVANQDEINNSFKDHKLRDNLIKLLKAKKLRHQNVGSDEFKKRSDENPDSISNLAKQEHNMMDEKQSGTKIRKLQPELHQELSELSCSSDDELSEDQMRDLQKEVQKEVNSDLKVFLAEVQNRSDERSCLIFDKMDGKIQRWLKTTKQGEGSNRQKKLNFQIAQS